MFFFPNIDFCVYICLHLPSSTSVCAINENCVRLTAFPLIKKNTNKRESGINVFYFYFYFVVKATTDDKTAHLITGYPTPLGGYVHCGTFPLWEMMTWMLTVVRITRHHPEGNCKTRSSPLGGSFFHIFVDPDSNHSYIHTFREGNAMSAPPKNIRRMRILFIFIVKEILSTCTPNWFNSSEGFQTTRLVLSWTSYFSLQSFLKRRQKEQETYKYLCRKFAIHLRECGYSRGTGFPASPRSISPRLLAEGNDLKKQNRNVPEGFKDSRWYPRSLKSSKSSITLNANGS